MLRFGCILLIILSLAAGRSAACTAFCLQTSQGIYVGKNLDWSIGHGYVFLNERNVAKSILVTELFGKNEFSWTSKYRSLTFNQFGKEFPLGGINEHGLVVEELNAPPVKNIPNDTFRCLNEFQLTQYLLDNCKTVNDIIELLPEFRYKPLIQQLHYLVADKTGKVLVLEFNGESFEFYSATDSGVPVLSNNNYTESIRYLSRFKGFGGDVEVKNRPGSNERFVTVAEGLQKYRNQEPVGYSFLLLNTVKQPDTKWSIVYDVNNLSIHFKFYDCEPITTFDFRGMLSQPELLSQGCDVASCDPEISVITAEMNTKLLNDVFSLLAVENGTEVDYNLLYKMAMAGNKHLEFSTNKRWVAELKKAVQKLPGANPLEYPDKFFRNLANWKEHDVVALGEATHGTKEFCELKQRIFRYLVENHGFRVLAYEYSFRKSIALNEYVLTQAGNPDSILQNASWIQNNAEVKHLINWMAGYNKNKSFEDKIHFVGIDNQIDAYTPGYVIEHIQKNFPAFSHQNLPLLTRVKELKTISYPGITNEEYRHRKELFSLLKNRLESYFETTGENQPDFQQHNTMRLALSLVKSHEFLYRQTKGLNIRDKYMAENLMELKKRFPGKKIAVWAHNAHVAGNPDYYGHHQPAMGWYLQKALGEKYFIVGTAFSQGEFKAVMLDENGNDTQPLTCRINTDPPSVSANRIFDSVHDNFVFDTKSIAPASALYDYLNKKLPVIGVGDLYLGSPEKHFTHDRIINLVDSYNLVFYFSYTNPVTLKE